ncbi:DUF1766-domain-containing protein [Mytilinidion resinicola]|uniref:DUF1766-domain-containing protein n=1 Tax=Mytilinidion resinicola TaxID=574789 RepID=A0A6A6YQD4_9PEZI|nr:DUF1766-domain-containing protein [Mytilinidion resinicola]KAF2811116.1 DUF1766-domain-containing protein [Mytilinidion resinicola]
MPFIPHTPEALLPRSDSKNPATTCKGITSSGRPCRRGLAVAKSPLRSSNGVLAVVSMNDGVEDGSGAAAFFCWQHKDQAEQLAAANNPPQNGADVTKLYPLQERSSIDTLVARLGILEVDDSNQTSRKSKRERRQDAEGTPTRPPRRVNRPPTWDKVEGPLMSVPGDLMAAGERRSSKKPAENKPVRPSRPPPRKQGFWASLCCGAVGDDYVEVVRHKKRFQAEAITGNPTNMSVATRPQYSDAFPDLSNGGLQNSRRRPVTGSASLQASTPPRKPLGEKPTRPMNRTTPSAKSETQTLLSYIPPSLPPQKASSLLAELSKPISSHDEEGFIYIFCLNSDPNSTPSTDAATLLAPPSRAPNDRRVSDVLLEYSNQPRKQSSTSTGSPGRTAGPGTLLLKIGRASNVHRRMNEWSRQCGYTPSLVRYYPYVPSSASPSPSGSPPGSPSGSPAASRRPSLQPNSRPSDPIRRVSEISGSRKAPHVHRVERLIHLELAEKRMQHDCDACGKTHREWFEIEATREGIRGVDEVVKRWVGWAEKAGLGAEG